MLAADIPFEHRGRPKRLQLVVGDITDPRNGASDLIVVSAFANDYLPTSTSVIGALLNSGISVEDLSRDKAIDLRHQYSCWLSKPLDSDSIFRFLLCIESGWRGTPPEITTDLFRALSPILIGDPSIRSLSTPLLGAGDQGWPAKQMLQAIACEAISWMKRGLPLDVFRIFLRTQPNNETINEIVNYANYEKDKTTLSSLQIDDLSLSMKTSPSASIGSIIDEPYSKRSHTWRTSDKFDVFISYAHDDVEYANIAKNTLKRFDARVFMDSAELRVGSHWLIELAKNLDSSSRVLAIYSPKYWESKYCQMEFSATLMRQMDTDSRLLYPVYLEETIIPWMFRTVQFQDCRVSDKTKLSDSCEQLIRDLRA